MICNRIIEKDIDCNDEAHIRDDAFIVLDSKRERERREREKKIVNILKTSVSIAID